MKLSLKNLKFNKQKVIIWSCCMAAVIIICVSVMSIIMVCNKITYGMKLMPHIDYVSKITITNSHYPTGKVANYDVEDDDTVQQKRIVQNILSYLSKSGKTNRFLQVFAGQDGGDEKIQRASSVTYENTLSTIGDGSYITITFNEASNSRFVQYIINKASPNQFKVETNDSTNETDTYKNSRVSKICIPLGTGKNSFDKHSWYIYLHGSTKFDYELITYANYKTLHNYVRDIQNI